MNAEDVNKIDWGKILMGAAVAIVFVMQQYHAMRLDEIRTVVEEHTRLDDDLEFNQENRKKVFKDIGIRLKRIEEKLWKQD
jgi:hypothetical protein